MTDAPHHDRDFTIRDNSKWRRAAHFLATVRDRQHRRGKKLSGPNRVSDEVLSAIRDSTTASHLIQATASAMDCTDATVHELFVRLSEMCRRNRITIPEEIRDETQFILAVELLANVEHLQSSAEKLIGATVQHGVLALHEDPELWETFKDEPWMLKRAAELYPGDPKGFLTDVLTTADAMRRDDRFAALQPTPYVFKRAAMNHSDPAGFLADVIARLNRIQQDERFVSLRDTPYAFTRAVISHSSDPEEFLVGVIAKIKQLEQNDDFAILRPVPHVFKLAAIDQSDPESYLNGLVRKVERFRMDERFALLREKPYMLIDAAVRNADPEQLVMRISRSTNKSKGDTSPSGSPQR